MTRRARQRVAWTSLFLLLGAAAAAGEIQDVVVSERSATLIRPHALSIHNAAEQPITIYVSTDDGQPSAQKLADGEVKEFTDGSSSAYIVRIPTGHSGEVKYRLEAQKRYQIYWNEHRELWDLVELAAGG